MAEPPSLTDRLLRWFDNDQRDLPWRQTRDPWSIWVSEVMLQQTRVSVVERLYPSFMQRFPSARSLAEASDDELLAAWRGLGYYRRARSLRAAAVELVERHDGQVPASVEALRALPGVGKYTAGAIASIAFGAPEPAIDGNVERVMARHRMLTGNVKQRSTARRVEAAVREAIPARRAGDFNQALMELGATVCTPQKPGCGQCPIAVDCRARAEDRTAEVPEMPARRQMVELVTRAILVPAAHGRVLGTRVPDGEVNHGQVELPGAGILQPIATVAELEEVLLRRFGVAFRVGTSICTVRHGITHHRIRLVVHEAKSPRGPGPNLMAVRPDDAGVPWTTASRKVFQQAALFLAARS